MLHLPARFAGIIIAFARRAGTGAGERTIEITSATAVWRRGGLPWADPLGAAP